MPRNSDTKRTKTFGVSQSRIRDWKPLPLDSLVGKYRNIFTCLEGKRQIPSNAFVMCLDAEWHEVSGRNNVLSYQVATLSRTAVNNVIEYMRHDQRLSLAEVVEIGIRSIHGGEIPESYRSSRNQVLLVAHHFSAEWSVLRDRMEPHILGNLNAVRKSPVTGRYLISIEIGDGIPFLVKIVDSRLLAPADYQSLKKLSSLLGSDKALKLDVTNYYKANMHLFLQRHPREFEAYALQDSAVTLKVYLLLLDSIIKLSGQDGKKGRAKIYRTLASGAVTGFLRKHQAMKEYFKKLKEPEYIEPIKLFRRAYHGGRNEGFLCGRTDRTPELDGRLWVDIDFCGCYPTAMSIIPAVANGINPLASEYDLLPPLRPGGRRRKVLKMDGPLLPVRYLPLTYMLDDRTDEEILKYGIEPGNYRRVKVIIDELNALPRELPADETSGISDNELREKENELYRLRATKHKEFEQALLRIRAGGDRDVEGRLLDLDVLKRKRGTKANREQVKRIRELATFKDNSLVEDWWQRSQAGGEQAERFVILGAARVRFKFPDDAEYPSLPISHPVYGLVFPLQGECVATAVDIVTAMEAGATIEALTSVEMPAQFEEDGDLPRRPFLRHLQDLTRERSKYKDQIKDDKLSANAHSKARVMEQLTKEYSNSFYGKTAQSISYSRVYDPRTGEMQSLGPSQISEAITGSLTTGLPRAALGAVLVAIERYNARQTSAARKILVASATTDGCLVGLPRPSKDFKTADCYKWDPDKGLILKDDFTKVETILKMCRSQGLMKEMMKFLALRQMRTARNELTGKPVFLEVKNLADHATFVKTRGQLGWIDYTDKRRPPYDAGRAFTITAKFGLKPPISDIVAEGVDLPSLSEWRKILLSERYARYYEGPSTDRNTLEGGWVLQQIDRLRDKDQQATTVFTYPFYTLTSFTEIAKAESENKDLIQKISDRKFNGDFDWKRRLKLRKDGSIAPLSKPYLVISQMLAHRSQMETERRWGRNALPEKVLQRVQISGRKTSMRGGEAATVTRIFLRLMVSKHLPDGKLGVRVPKRLNQVWSSLGLKMQAMEPRNKDGAGDGVKNPASQRRWNHNDIKSAKRSKVLELQIIQSSLPLLNLVDALAQEFRVDADKLKSLIFAPLFDDEINSQLVSLVARSVLHGPRRGLEPFRKLYLQGRLPTQRDLVRTFHPHLTDSIVEVYAHGDFRAGEAVGWDRPRLARLFRQLGLPSRDAEACAKRLVLPSPGKETAPVNPARKRCLECFVHALHQPDLVSMPISAVRVLERLQPYGLKRHRYYALKHSKFVPRSLTNTAANRGQISKMSRALGFDPEPLMEALLDR